MRNIKSILISPYLRIILLIILIAGTNDSNLILSCGLFAFIGGDPELFSWDKFNILGLFNDSRGGDACGRVFGNTHQYGVDALKYYKDFAASVPIPEEENTAGTILGHCRKASSGGTNRIYAQPIVLKKKDLNLKAIKDTHLKSIIKTMDKDDIIFSGIHNGTIDNYEDLAPTYGIPTEDHNDSKVLLSALFYGNFDILSKYIGTAALVWHNHVYNKTYIFKGSSKSYKETYASTEERPLFLGYIGKDFRNFYVSSLDKALSFIGITDENIIDLKENMIFSFKDGQKLKPIEVDRSKCYQNVSYTNRVSGYAYSSKNRHPNYDKFNRAYAEYEGYAGADDFGDAVDCKQIELWNSNSKAIITPNGIPLIRFFEYGRDSIRIQAEICDEYNGSFAKGVTYNKTRYWLNGALMHGTYALNNWGNVPSLGTVNTYALKLYYFVEGILMDGLPAYGKAMDEHHTLIEDCYQNPLDMDTTEQLFTESVAKYSRYPVASLTKMRFDQDICTNMGVTDGDLAHTGHIQPLFSNRRYITNKGAITDIQYVSGGIRIGAHTTDDNKAVQDYLKSCARGELVLKDSQVGYDLIFKENFMNPLSPFQDAYIGSLGLEAVFDEKLYLVHYMRDFNPQLKNQCKACPNNKTIMPSICMNCSSLRTEYLQFKKRFIDDNNDE